MMKRFSEDPKERAERYIGNLSKTLEALAVNHDDSVVSATNISRVIDTIRRYTDDARHYLIDSRPTTSLASVAYAEGLLDALTFLELAKPKQAQ